MHISTTLLTVFASQLVIAFPSSFNGTGIPAVAKDASSQVISNSPSPIPAEALEKVPQAGAGNNGPYHKNPDTIEGKPCSKTQNPNRLYCGPTQWSTQGFYYMTSTIYKCDAAHKKWVPATQPKQGGCRMVKGKPVFCTFTKGRKDTCPF